MSSNGDRRQLLEHYGRCYAEHGLAVVWTRGLNGDDAKAVTASAWQTTQPLSEAEFAAGLFATRGLRANPAIAARTSGLVLIDCDTPEGLAEIEALGLPSTVTVQSSAPHKRHFWFKAPLGARRLPKVGFRFEAGGFSADANRYLVCPPALHPSGVAYVFLPGLGPDEVEIATLELETYEELLRRGKASEARTREAIEDPEAKIRAGKRREAIFRHACMQRRWGLSREATAVSAHAFNRERCEPPVAEHLVEVQVDGAMRMAGGQELDAGPAPYAGPWRQLETVLETFRAWLHLPDAGLVYAVCATVAANRVESFDPTWLIVVGAAGSGKTEALSATSRLEGVHVVGTLTEASLLSGTPRKDTATDASGGLLRVVGDSGTIILKDFGSILSMHREARAAVLAALRELFDGSWTRLVGTDGGRRLHWEGRLGLLAGATGVLDSHHGVLAQLGERFLIYRVAVDDAHAQARRSLAHHGREHSMRRELGEAIAGLFTGLDLSSPPPLTDADVERLVSLAVLVARARSPVVRDAYRRELELVPDSEAPGRIVGALGRLLTGLRLIGVDDEEAWRVTVKTGLDSMPAVRLRALERLLGRDPLTTTELATALGLPNPTTHRVLEELDAHGLLHRESQGQGKADLWHVEPWTRERYREATTSSETSESLSLNGFEYTNDDISEEVGGGLA